MSRSDFCAQLRALLLVVCFGSHLGSFLLPTGSNAMLRFARIVDRRIYSPDTMRQRRELKATLKVQYRNESWMSPWEAIMMFFFAIFVLVLFTREPTFFPGWTSFLSVEGDVTDASPTVLVFLLLAFMPVQALEMTSKDRALHWKSVLPHVPWGLGLVLASGNAIAFAARVVPSTLNLIASVLTCLVWYQIVFSGPFTLPSAPILPLNKTHAILYVDQ
ncbi:hypothetical protein V5799_006952 [Amblyomma americanum]|uniref:Uncharacterized protein n=1 Tax=Amblyomma americanum TaxID=6943 RepID=A0AAQ4DUX6_AMBAM